MIPPLPMSPIRPSRAWPKPLVECSTHKRKHDSDVPCFDCLLDRLSAQDAEIARLQIAVYGQSWLRVERSADGSVERVILDPEQRRSLATGARQL